MPISDGSASIYTTTRARWYAPIEDQGAHAGYFYSLRGGGDRREVFARINQYCGLPIQGLNRIWGKSLGIPVATNRSLVIRKLEQRANLIELSLQGLPEISSTSDAFSLGAPLQILTTNQSGGTLQAALTYSFNGQGNCSLQVFADRDENSLNGWISDVTYRLDATGDVPQKVTFSLQSLFAKLAPGFYRVGSLISSTSGQRELYAPQRLFIFPDLSLAWTPLQVGADVGFNFTVRGLRNTPYVLESSDDLVGWSQVYASRLSNPGGVDVTGLDVRNGITKPSKSFQFFRARYSQ